MLLMRSGLGSGKAVVMGTPTALPRRKAAHISILSATPRRRKALGWFENEDEIRDEKGMQFWNFPAEKGIVHWSEGKMREWIRGLPMAPLERNQMLSEWKWMQEKRPYYDLYPAIVPLLENVDLSDVPVSIVKPPLPQLVVRLPKAQHSLRFESAGKEYLLRSVFFAESLLAGRPSIQVAIDYGEVGPEALPALLCRHWCRDKNESIQTVMERIKPSQEGSVAVPGEFLTRVITMLTSLCMLGDDPEVIQPDVLVSDQAEYAKTGDAQYVKAAHEHGKRGWAVGKDIQKVPHVRRSHLAKFWVGPGRTKLILRLRQGSIVRRTCVTEIPTGYLDECRTEVAG